MLVTSLLLLMMSSSHLPKCSSVRAYHSAAHQERERDGQREKSSRSAVTDELMDDSKKKKKYLLPLTEGTKQFVPAGCSAQCSRGKVGESASAEFHRKPAPWSYKGLHDEHLRNFFNKNPAKKKHLVDEGLITENGQMLCSIREFNQYIGYLKTIDSEWGKALQKQEREINLTFSNVKVTGLKKQPEEKEQRIKPGLKNQTQTLNSSIHTVEPDDDCVKSLSLDLLQRSQELKLIDLEEEGHEGGQEESIETSTKKKINMSELMKKPIGTKLFVPEGCSMQYSRGKVGESLYQDTTQFDLRDPHMRQMPGTYISLHDKHLKKFFNKPGRRKQLIEQGLITEDGDVLCSLKEFNQYVDFQKFIKPKLDVLLFPDVRVSPVEEVEKTEGTSKDDIPAGPKKVKVLAFFNRAWKAVKRAFTRRRRSETSPVR